MQIPELTSVALFSIIHGFGLILYDPKKNSYKKQCKKNENITIKFVGTSEREESKVKQVHFCIKYIFLRKHGKEKERVVTTE